MNNKWFIGQLVVLNENNHMRDAGTRAVITGIDPEHQTLTIAPLGESQQYAGVFEDWLTPAYDTLNYTEMLHLQTHYNHLAQSMLNACKTFRMEIDVFNGARPRTNELQTRQTRYDNAKSFEGKIDPETDPDGYAYWQRILHIAEKDLQSERELAQRRAEYLKKKGE